VASATVVVGADNVDVNEGLDAAATTIVVGGHSAVIHAI
jgi:hypothetical protein